MIAHAMKYVSMASVMAKEETTLASDFEFAAKILTEAERDLVRAYGRFRYLLEQAAAEGNETAKAYLQMTYWDLT